MPYYPVNTNKRTERKLTLGQLITMATHLMKASMSKTEKKNTTRELYKTSQIKNTVKQNNIHKGMH